MKYSYFHTPYIFPHRSARQVFDWLLQLASITDEAGFLDFMISEHYTLAWENIPAPEIVIGAAAQITKNIRFAPMPHLLRYHNPATLAMRIGWLSQIPGDCYSSAWHLAAIIRTPSSMAIPPLVNWPSPWRKR